MLLTNYAARPLTDYHVDLLFPRAPLLDADRHPLYVQDRSNQEFAFFRFASAGTQVVYPGDSSRLIELTYQMTTALYQGHARLFASVVTASLYCAGTPPLVIEAPFQELQNF